MKTGIRIAFLICVFLIAGCMATQHMSKRDESFPDNYKLGPTAITWRQNPSIDIQITRRSSGSKPTITAEDQTLAQNEFRQLMSTISTLSVAEFTARLKDKDQAVVPSFQDAKTLIAIMPVKGLTDCTGERCAHSLALEVSVIDIASRKVVWKGGFKVGLSVFDKAAGLTVDHQVVESFAGAVMLALRKERFI